MIKYGFQIIDNEIYDTKIDSFKIKAHSVGSDVIYTMFCVGYKRLSLFEPLLDKYDSSMVFEILRLNDTLRKDRELNDKEILNKNHYISNSTMVYNYPAKYLTPRMFQLYKTCQKLKQKVHE